MHTEENKTKKFVSSPGVGVIQAGLITLFIAAALVMYASTPDEDKIFHVSGDLTKSPIKLPIKMRYP